MVFPDDDGEQRLLDIVSVDFIPERNCWAIRAKPEVR